MCDNLKKDTTLESLQCVAQILEDYQNSSSFTKSSQQNKHNYEYFWIDLNDVNPCDEVKDNVTSSIDDNNLLEIKEDIDPFVTRCHSPVVIKNIDIVESDVDRLKSNLSPVESSFVMKSRGSGNDNLGESVRVRAALGTVERDRIEDNARGRASASADFRRGSSWAGSGGAQARTAVDSSSSRSPCQPADMAGPRDGDRLSLGILTVQLADVLKRINRPTAFEKICAIEDFKSGLSFEKINREMKFVRDVEEISESVEKVGEKLSSAREVHSSGFRAGKVRENLLWSGARVVGAGARRRRRAAPSIRRRGPSVRPPRVSLQFCSGSAAPRVRLHFAATESKSEKTSGVNSLRISVRDRRKKASPGAEDSSSEKSQDPAPPAEACTCTCSCRASKPSSQETQTTPNPDSQILTSKALNGFEFSSRLKRLEDKLLGSLKTETFQSSRTPILTETQETNQSNVKQNSDCIQLNELKEDQTCLNFVEEKSIEETDTNENSKHIENKPTSVISHENVLEKLIEIQRELNLKEYCTERAESSEAESESRCPTKKILETSEYYSDSEGDGSSWGAFLAGNKLTEESDSERAELEEFEREERRAANEEYFRQHAALFASSTCQFQAGSVPACAPGSRAACYDEREDLGAGAMRGEQRAADDRRHNKDASNLRSLLKRAPKTKKNRVIFNENKNEFFEADYIILIREECQYDEESDEGVCTCSQHEMVRLQACCEEEGAECAPPADFGDQLTLSPPEGYKDSALFNRDGTFKEQSFFAGAAAGAGGVLVSEGSGAVFTPQHLRQLQVIQRLQREQLRRARAALKPQADGSPAPTDEELLALEDANEETDKAVAKASYAKEIVAGEERPKVNSGQQTTPTEEVQRYVETTSSTTQADRRMSRESNPPRSKDEEEDNLSGHEGSPMRLGGILKGGRLWKPMEAARPEGAEQVEESGSFSNPPSDEEGRAGRAVRFSEPGSGAAVDLPGGAFRLGLGLSTNSLRPNSAVRQLFPAGPHFTASANPADKQYLVTAESLRAFEEAKRSKLPSSYQEEDSTVRKTIDRNTLRRSLIKVDPKKKAPVKNDTSLSERIKMLTCNLDDEETDVPDGESQGERGSPTGEEARPLPQPPSKSFSPSSSSSASSCSSTSSAYKKLTDLFPKRQQDRIAEVSEETCNAPPTSAGRGPNQPQGQAHRAGGQGQRVPGMPGPPADQPAPDVIAGTPGAGDGDELARFVQQDAARNERLRQRYTPQSTVDNSDEDDQDDYGFQRRPSVRGIKPRFGSTNEILQQMQSQLMPPTARPGHVSWPYYSESNLVQPAPHEHHLAQDALPNRSSMEDFQQNLKPGEQAARDCCDLRNHNVPEQRHLAEHARLARDESIYQNCVTYANIRCNGGNEREMCAVQAGVRGRPESPPPIRSYHQTMVLIPYASLPPYCGTLERPYRHVHGEQNGSLSGYPQQQPGNETPTLLKISQNSQQMVSVPFPQTGVPMQITCSAPVARMRAVPSRPVPRHMICYSEKVQAPLYQAAPGSPGAPAAVRGAPEGAPAPAVSPTNPHLHQHNSVYYAMNV